MSVQTDVTALETVVEVVLISPDQMDGCLSGLVIASLRLRVVWFPTLQSALAYLKNHLVGIVISKAELPDGCWKDAVDGLSDLKVPPSLIVFAPQADERMWAEVLNLGGYDVLSSSSTPEEILRICAEAWLAWRRKLMETITPRKPPNLEMEPRTVETSALAAPSGT